MARGAHRVHRSVVGQLWPWPLPQWRQLPAWLQLLSRSLYKPAARKASPFMAKSAYCSNTVHNGRGFQHCLTPPLTGEAQLPVPVPPLHTRLHRGKQPQLRQRLPVTPSRQASRPP